MKYLQILGTTRGGYSPNTIVTVQVIDDSSPVILGPFRYEVEGDVNPSDYGLFIAIEAQLKSGKIVPTSENVLHVGLMGGDNKAEITAILDKTSILNDGADVAIIAGLPNPIMVRINKSPPQVIEGGTLEVTATIKGQYTIEVVDEINYLPKEWTIDCIES